MNCRNSRFAFLVTCLIALGATFSADGQVIQRYVYKPGSIYQVNAGLGIATQIVLSPYENILDYSTGFSNGWDIRRRGNVFYLRPRNVDVDTNMIVRTETHSYIFELRVVATDWKSLSQAKGDGVQYKITFDYPSDTIFNSSKKSADTASPISTTLEPDRSYDFDYEYSASKRTAPWMIPEAVYDDGYFTYIKLRDSVRYPTGDFPAVFMRETEHGQDAVVNTTVKGNTIIVHGTFPYLVIRQGDNVVGLRRDIKP
jgi:type IV secretion system protein VirB9